MMATFQKSSSMSDDSAYRLAKMLFGLDRAITARLRAWMTLRLRRIC